MAGLSPINVPHTPVLASVLYYAHFSRLGRCPFGTMYYLNVILAACETPFQELQNFSEVNVTNLNFANPVIIAVFTLNLPPR
jgi:hypothetical protein